MGEKEDIVIKYDAIPVVKKILGRMEEDAKMIDGWKVKWQKERIHEIEQILFSLGEARNLLLPLKYIGIVLRDIEDALLKATRQAEKLLAREKKNLEIMHS
jgi:hypothetical protein